MKSKIAPKARLHSFAAIAFTASIFCWSHSPLAHSQQLAASGSNDKTIAELPSAPDVSSTENSSPSSSNQPNPSDATVEGPSKKPKPPSRKPWPLSRFTKGAEVSVGSFDWITGRDVGSTQITQGTTSAAGLLASYHQQIRPLIGYNVNFAWTKFSETYRPSYPNYLLSPYHYTIPNNVYEVSSMWVVEQPRNSSRIRVFAEGGGGVLMFIPRRAPFAGYSSYRAAVLYGAGAEYRMDKHWSLRAEYRGLFYKNPDFAAAPLTGLATTKNFTFSTEPTVSLTYHLGGKP